jgi:hypothetical protein
MAENKKRNGVGVPVSTTKATPTVKRDLKLWKRVKDPAGFWKWEKRKTGAKVLPPSVRAKREARAKQPPPVKYAGKRKAPKTKIPKPLPRSQPSSRRGHTFEEYTKYRKPKGAVGGGRK